AEPSPHHASSFYRKIMHPLKLKNIVPEYHSSNVIIRRLFEARIQRAIAISGIAAGSTECVLDAGCGEGVLLRDLHATFPGLRLTGIDIHDDTLSLREEMPPAVEIRQESLTRAPFPDAHFDRIFCLDILEHFEDLEEPCREIRRLLKPSGRLVISAPTESFFYRFGRFLSKGTWSEKEGPGAGPHYWDARGLERSLIDHGFSLELKTLIPPLPPLDLFHLNVYTAG
ncbi:MAG: class I SAM-dependent methyltransferase, partial [Chloroflexi bacterium]|nr:class I SAM-dependent methyltransferase [Chloroflexota bacterium]